MELNDKVTQLEDEIKILKNEVQSVLLDLRESFLKNENPFNTSSFTPAAQPIIINQQAPAAVEGPPVKRAGKSESDIAAEEETGRESSVEDQEEETEIPDREKALPVTKASSDEVNPEKLPATEKTIPLVEPFAEAAEISFPEPVPMKNNTCEEIDMTWQSASDTVAQFKPRETNDSKCEKFELNDIANLAQWVEDSTNRLGQDKIKSILDILETIGYISTDLKNLLIKFINNGGEQAPEATSLDYLIVLTELERLTGRENNKPNEIPLLYILCKESDNR